MTRPHSTSQVQVKLILSLSTLSTHAMNEREQDMLALRMAKRINDGQVSQKVRKAHINEDNHRRDKAK